jgi:predicted small secreted protein
MIVSEGINKFVPFAYRKDLSMTRNRHNFLDRYLTPLALMIISIALVACNTTEGAGKDIEAAGDAIEDAAQDAND